MKRRVVVSLAVLVFAVAGVAGAEPPDRALWLGVFGGLHVNADHWDLNVDGRSASEIDTLAGMVGLRIGV